MRAPADFRAPEKQQAYFVEKCRGATEWHTRKLVSALLEEKMKNPVKA